MRRKRKREIQKKKGKYTIKIRSIRLWADKNINNRGFVVSECSRRIIRIKDNMYPGVFRDALIGTGIGCFYVWLFLKNLSFYLFVIPFVGVYVGAVKKNREGERREKLAIEFKDVLQSMSGALFVGYSVERSISQAAEEIRLLYGKNSLLYPELLSMERKISVQQTVEQCFAELGERTQVEEIKLFAQVFVSAKRTGGDIQRVIYIAAESIRDRIDWKRELKILVGEKKAEKKVMNIIPLCLIVYMRLVSPDLMYVMYQGVGQIMMGFCLLMYIVFFVMGEQILRRAIGQE